ncbi:phospho-sugar mutase [Rubellicoccus peritrichatus]|uniref:Phospho-sugar mutase n=1 Tax=Rubellicoccus peritrichatus TaxID=3080537 RepID=A0AAQ3QS84_9BACT|nr:phospho-sugar mutase [Puniceicoccus sp. CR14]WOO42143.1 phospho-sugar mutase [Puniceicoccus sp. CR14]
MAITEAIKSAGERGELMETAVINLEQWLNGSFLPEWARKAITELVEAGEWGELNERFYKDMKFGTGGIRGRTIGQTTPPSEQGKSTPEGAPEHPAVGTNVLNDFLVIRATMGLFRHCKQHLADEERYDIPKLVIAHDVRHYSRHFCELSASTWTKLGGLAMIFDGPRATPHLSFAVRHLHCTAGVVITASHNPPHDNGFKAYFSDGAQVVSPHAESIISEVEKVSLEELPQFLEKDLSKVITLPSSVDEAYYEVLEENVLDPDVFEAAHPKFVFTPNHGTGAVSAIPLLEAFNIDIHPVAEQMVQDPRFPTLKSPNPEIASAFDMALAEAEKLEADAVIATDPDADRLGIGARTVEGKMKLYTGNMLGSCLAEYRVSKLKEMGIIPAAGSEHAALIKTFVTTPLQQAIAESHGLKCINTLTGFKWIGEKLNHYQEELEEKLWDEEGIALNYDHTDLSTRVSLLLEYSTYYVFGGEESYGYLASDRVRDKDASGAIIMFCELMCYLKTQGLTLEQYLDGIYLKYGYYAESLLNIYMEGASGSEQIQRIITSYSDNPPTEIDGIAVTNITNFAQDELKDADGKRIPKEKFFFIELANGYSYAVRGSGTEPKIKFYCFAKENVSNEAELGLVKDATTAKVKALQAALEADAHTRAGA